MKVPAPVLGLAFSLGSPLAKVACGCLLGIQLLTAVLSGPAAPVGKSRRVVGIRKHLLSELGDPLLSDVIQNVQSFQTKVEHSVVITFGIDHQLFPLALLLPGLEPVVGHGSWDGDSQGKRHHFEVEEAHNSLSRSWHVIEHSICEQRCRHEHSSIPFAESLGGCDGSLDCSAWTCASIGCKCPGTGHSSVQLLHTGDALGNGDGYRYGLVTSASKSEDSSPHTLLTSVCVVIHPSNLAVLVRELGSSDDGLSHEVQKEEPACLVRWCIRLSSGCFSALFWTPSHGSGSIDDEEHIQMIQVCAYAGWSRGVLGRRNGWSVGILNWSDENCWILGGKIGGLVRWLQGGVFGWFSSWLLSRLKRGGLGGRKLADRVHSQVQDVFGVTGL